MTRRHFASSAAAPLLLLVGERPVAESVSRDLVAAGPRVSVSSSDEPSPFSPVLRFSGSTVPPSPGSPPPSLPPSLPSPRAAAPTAGSESEHRGCSPGTLAEIKRW